MPGFDDEPRWVQWEAEPKGGPHLQLRRSKFHVSTPNIKTICGLDWSDAVICQFFRFPIEDKCKNCERILKARARRV